MNTNVNNTITTTTTTVKPVIEVNPHMKLGHNNVGILTPPDALYKPVLYSHAEATRDFNKLDRDAYMEVKRTEPECHKKKTPKSVWAALGAAAVGLLVLSRKSIK